MLRCFFAFAGALLFFFATVVAVIGGFWSAWLLSTFAMNWIQVPACSISRLLVSLCLSPLTMVVIAVVEVAIVYVWETASPSDAISDFSEPSDKG